MSPIGPPQYKESLCILQAKKNWFQNKTFHCKKINNYNITCCSSRSFDVFWFSLRVLHLYTQSKVSYLNWSISSNEYVGSCSTQIKQKLCVQMQIEIMRSKSTYNITPLLGFLDEYDCLYKPTTWSFCFLVTSVTLTMNLKLSYQSASINARYLDNFQQT